LHFSPFKMISIAVLCLAAMFYAIPTLFDKATVESWPRWLPQKQISLGLDLRGGAHLLLSMDTNELRDDMLTSLRADARASLLRERIGFRALAIRNQSVQVRVAKAVDEPRALTALQSLSQPLDGGLLVGTTDRNVTVERGADGIISLTLTDAALRKRVTDAIGAAIETVRRRVDPTGNVDATITRNGDDRILVQVPGVDDTRALKDRIGKVALLSFHAVHQDLYYTGGPIPPGYKTAESVEAPGQQYLIRASSVVRGDDLVDASPGFDERTRAPEINFRFNQSGGRKFGTWTSANVGRPFAILLDGQVISAPVVQTAILGGAGRITGQFTPEEANNLAINLKSGALPAKLTVIEERTVGPTLGADSIASGLSAFAIGGIATLIFTIFVYGTFGLIAVAGLFINALLIIAAMTLLGSTLTLPGIAGLVLTIGMAIDANVLIYERIREELRNGKNAVEAIDTGFGRAMVTIIDSQLTTLAAALIMFWLGSGPIRGFAVTLSIGIFTSVFTAVTVVRLLVSLWLRAERAKSRAVDVPI
ncbi:MAG: protein translocase subunit SecD, partial [Pseudomonadota bacterium]